MTKVYYKCTDSQGKQFIVKTFAEAKRIKLEGGKYERVLEETLSKCEAYSREGARRAGDLR